MGQHIINHYVMCMVCGGQLALVRFDSITGDWWSTDPVIEINFENEN